MLQSPILGILGLKYPVFQGGMAWVSDAKLAAAVSNAGGLGIIGAGNAPGSFVRGEIRRAREMTDRPFAVNIMLMSPYAEEVAAVVAGEKVKIAVTGAGNPEKYMKMWHENGVSVIPVIPSAAIARRMERAGAAAVVAEGCESGGHIGELTTMALVPQVAGAVNIPVIAAGGIADGRGMAAALMLGAVGVQIGTRFLSAVECGIHPNYKNKVLNAKDIDTVVTGRRLGHPVRSLKTPFSRAYFAKEYDCSISGEELEALGAGALKLAAADGDEKNGCFIAGQIAGLVTKEQTALEIIEEMCAEAEQLLSAAAKWVI